MEGWFTDDTVKRFEAYGWQVIPAIDGHDFAALDAAIAAAKADTARPTLICCRTKIGRGAPNKEGGHDVHGAPLATPKSPPPRAHLNWPHAPFEIPADIASAWNAWRSRRAREAEWTERFAAYRAAFPAEAAEFERRMRGELPANWAHTPPPRLKNQRQGETIATRKASQNAIEAFAPALPELLGGSADLASSNLTLWSGSRASAASKAATMCITACANSAWRHHERRHPARRFQALRRHLPDVQRIRPQCPAHGGADEDQPDFCLYHDSIGLGEDGPTHQPVEQTATLRLIPNMDTWRPADTVESAVAWQAAIERQDGPSTLIFSRQNLPFLSRDAEQIAAIRRGGCAARGGQGLRRADRHRLGSRAGAESPGPAGRRRHCRARGLHAVHQCVRPPGQGLYRLGAAGGPAARGGGSRRPTSGASMSAWKAAWLVWTTLANPPRPSSCSKPLASPRPMSPRP